MAKDIRIIYIVSIITIVAFLCMQFYWLYNRYEYSIREYQGTVTENVQEAMNDYYRYRDNHVSKEWSGKAYRNLSQYSMGYQTDEAGKRHHIVSVTAWRFKPWRVLGVDADTPLSDAEVQMALQLVRESRGGEIDSVYVSEAADDSPNEAATWSAAEAVAVEFKNPFVVSGIDSLLAKRGIDAQVTLANTAKIEWERTIKINSSIFNPTVTIIIPYSPLEKKSVEIRCAVPASHLLHKMYGTLVIVVLISILLIVCLLWQFKIIFRLDRLDKMRNDFVSTMVHELKRPVSTLKMCVSSLRNHEMMADPEIREEILIEAKDGLDLLSTYFSKMRDLTFNNSEQIPLSCETIVLPQLIDAVICKMTIPTGKQITFDVRGNDDLEIFADKTHISNVLINLIENAIKYSGEAVKVTISATKNSNGSVSICVGDNGNGIPQADLGKIFSRYYRGSAASTDIPGLGLGLAYVKLLVEAHGGTISVNSKTNGVQKGTQFLINIPQ